MAIRRGPLVESWPNYLPLVAHPESERCPCGYAGIGMVLTNPQLADQRSMPCRTCSGAGSQLLIFATTSAGLHPVDATSKPLVFPGIKTDDFGYKYSSE